MISKLGDDDEAIVFVKVVRMAEQRPADERLFTAPKLLAMVKENAQAEQQFKEELLECTKKLSEGIWAEAYNTILRLFFENLLTAPRSQVFNPLKI